MKVPHDARLLSYCHAYIKPSFHLLSWNVNREDQPGANGSLERLKQVLCLVANLKGYSVADNVRLV